MRILLVCAALCAASSSNVLASTEFPPAATTFAYGSRHSVLEMPAGAIAALRPTDDTPAQEGSVAADTNESAVDGARPTIVVQPQKLMRVYSRGELCTAAASVAEANNLPISFFTNLIQQESGFKPHAVSPAGAQGIAQFMPRVAAAYGLHNPFDPIHALVVSGRFLRELLEQFGNNLGLAAAAYNGGSGRVGSWLAKKGKLPAETRTYVQNITGRPVEQWVRGRAKAEEVRLPKHARCLELRTLEARVTMPAQPGHDVAVAPPATARYALASSSAGKKLHVAASAGRKTIVIGGATPVGKQLGKKSIAIAALQPAAKASAAGGKTTAVAAAKGKGTSGAAAAAKPGKVNTTIMVAEKNGGRKAANTKVANTKVASATPAVKAAEKPASGNHAGAKKLKVAAR